MQYVLCLKNDNYSVRQMPDRLFELQSKLLVLYTNRSENGRRKILNNISVYFFQFCLGELISNFDAEEGILNDIQSYNPYFMTC